MPGTPPSRRQSLAVVMITQDAEATLASALESVQWADEIVVLDGGSHDGTVAIAKRLGARVIERRFTDFASQRNAALGHAACDWILSLDADEVVTPELAREIEAVLEHGVPWLAAEIPFKNFLGERWMRHGGLFPDHHLRLFRRGSGRFEREVHEVLVVDGPHGRLRGCIEHRTYADVPHLQRKVERYAALEARKVAALPIPSLVFLAKVPYRFLQVYVLRAGFMDGKLGLVHALALTRYAWLVYRATCAIRSTRPGRHPDAC